MKKHIISIAIIIVTVISSFAQETPKFSKVVNPSIPKSITFAGQKIDFDRIDMYERLDRELTSLSYTHGNTLLVIKRANRIFPLLAPILKENGLPLFWKSVVFYLDFLGTKNSSFKVRFGL